jgi:hypothetical protein
MLAVHSKRADPLASRRMKLINVWIGNSASFESAAPRAPQEVEISKAIKSIPHPKERP